MLVESEVKKKNIRKVLTGNQASAYGAYLSKVQVVASYPITPQTTIIETLAELMTNAKWPYRFINVESEHSALAACIGAALAGARVFTATSAQGLALMHELIHWAARARISMVLTNVNRAMAPGWSIWTDQNDSLSQRDTGWIQFYCESAQEVLDTTIQSFRVSERVNIPIMLVLDAFVLSHTGEVVELPDEDNLMRFLPPKQVPFKLDVDNPSAFGGLLPPDFYQSMSFKLHRDMQNALEVIKQVDLEYNSFFGRKYGVIDEYRCDDAEIILVTSGTVSSTARLVVDEFREKRKVRLGRVKVRLFRPFPFDDIVRSFHRAKKVAVIDRNISYGCHGIFFQEVKSALYNISDSDKKRPKLYGYITGLGGKDVTVDIISKVVELTLERDEPEPETLWL